MYTSQIMKTLYVSNRADWEIGFLKTTTKRKRFG